jgi:hypothetical protein
MGRIAEYQPTPRVQQMAQQIMQLTPQEISQLVRLVSALRRPTKIKSARYEVRAPEFRDYVLRELANLGDEYRPMGEDDSFIGGLRVKEYFALPDTEQERLWNEQHRMEIDDFEEHDVRPDAQLPAR